MWPQLLRALGSGNSLARRDRPQNRHFFRVLTRTPDADGRQHKVFLSARARVCSMICEWVSETIQGLAKEWAIGCVNFASWLPLAAGGEFTQFDVFIWFVPLSVQWDVVIPAVCWGVCHWELLLLLQSAPNLPSFYAHDSVALPNCQQNLVSNQHGHPVVSWDVLESILETVV